MFNGYRPQVRFGERDVTGIVALPEGMDMLMPGGETTMTFELISPVPMGAGSQFTLVEGGRSIGTGSVTSVLD
jgi:elongation factor Tu